MSMIDEGISTDPSLSIADQAVNYLLRRIQLDADLRWHMRDTEAYHRLCQADAARRGISVDASESQWGTPPERLKDKKARLPEALKTISELETKIDAMQGVEAVDEERESTIEEAMDLCPRCSGIPYQSINRCPMCRKLQGAL